MGSVPNEFWNYTSFYRYNTIMKSMICFLFALLIFTGCSNKVSSALEPISYGSYKKVSFEEIPSWEDENFDEVFACFQKTCEKSSRKPLFKHVCSISQQVKNSKAFFEQHFTPFVSTASKSLATGYYEPTLKGSYTQSEHYPYALYGIPDDLIRIEVNDAYQARIKRPLRGRLENGKVVPYYSRQEISENALADQAPICYVSDKVDLFFLQVQGSGRVLLDDNSSIYVGYGDQNGFPYHSIGKEMLKRGYLKEGEVSLRSIHNYFDNNPQEIDTILNTNPSYIFFQKRERSASGALGVTLDGGRSVAVDRENIPLGMPLFISTREPLSNERYERVVFAHDTGGAIKGESRIDIFFGSDDKAKEQAGMMQAQLELWMLVPNDYLVQSKGAVE